MRAQVLSDVTPLTRTAEFRRWFGASKIVDAAGDPLVVYHGTAIEKDQFRREGGCSGCGAYFTPDMESAQSFAESDASIDGDSPLVLAVFLSIQNPYITDFQFDPATYDKDADPQAITEVFRDRLEAQGFDGIHIRNTDEYVVFRPEQVKLAYGNTGTFNPADPRIALKRDEVIDRADEEDELECTPKF